MTDPTVDFPIGGPTWAAPQVVVDVGNLSTDDGHYELWVVERDGTKVCHLEQATVTSCTDDVDLLVLPTLEFSIPKADPLVAEIVRVEREVMLLRSGVVLFVGPVLQKRSKGSVGERTFGASGVAWYLYRRLAQARIEPVWSNLLDNPSFEADLDRWATVAGAPTITSFSDGDGIKSAELGAGTAIRQALRIGYDITYTLRASARVWISADVPSGDQAGLYVTVPGVDVGASGGTAYITDATPRETWTTLEATFTVKGRPAGRDVNYLIGNGTGAGTITVDHTGLNLVGAVSLAESYGWRAPTPDQIEETEYVARHVNGGNDDLHLGVTTLATGQTIADEDHTEPWMIADAIRPILEREGGVDYAIIATEFTRTLTPYYPERGRDLTATVAFRYGTGDRDTDNLYDYDLDEDASKARSEVIVRGDDGAYGQASDDTAWGGLRLTEIIQAPPGTQATDLEGVGRKALLADSGDVEALTLYVSDGSYIDRTAPGDIVAVHINDHDVQRTGQPYRIIQRTIRPVTDSVEVVTNAHPGGGS